MRHEIKTIADLIAVANEKNLQNLIKDLGSFLAMHVGVKHLTKAIGGLGAAAGDFDSTFHWIDDGKNDITLTITTKTK